MTKEELEELTLDQLANLAMKQEESIGIIRGYKTWLTKDRIKTLGKEKLIESFLKNEKQFHIETNLY